MELVNTKLLSREQARVEKTVPTGQAQGPELRGSSQDLLNELESYSST